MDVRDNEAQHDVEVLSSLSDEIRRGQQHDDDVETKHHGEELRLQDSKLKTGDNDVGEGTEAAGGKSSENLYGAVAPDLYGSPSLAAILTMSFEGEGEGEREKEQNLPEDQAGPP